MVKWLAQMKDEGEEVTPNVQTFRDILDTHDGVTGLQTRENSAIFEATEETKKALLVLFASNTLGNIEIFPQEGRVHHQGEV